MKLYSEGKFLYYEDGTQKFCGSSEDFQLEDLQNGDVTIWFFQNRGREHKTFNQGIFPITDVLDADGNPYGATVEDITSGLNTAISVQLKDGIDGFVSADNSTSTPLGSGAIFTGISIDTLNYGMVIVNVKTDQDSAVDGLDIQFSSDNTNWDHSDMFSIFANGGKVFTFQTVARYMRVVYTNGAIAQTVFRLQTILKPNYVKPSSHRIADSLSGQDDAELVKAILSGEDQDNVFQNVKTTRDGNLSIFDNSSGLAIARGKVSDSTFIHKFGIAPDFDTGDNYVTIWEGADDGGIDQMNYVYSTTDDIDSLISTNNGDSVSIKIFGLDINFDGVEQTIALNGQTRVALTTPLIRVFRMYNIGSVDLAGVVSCYVNSSTTNGVVDNSANVRAIINGGNNQTLMAVYTIPNGKTAYLREWYANIGGASKSTNYVIEVRVRNFGQVFRLGHVSALSEAGTSYIQHQFVEPPIVTGKSDIELRCSITATGVSAAAIAAGFDLVIVDD